MKTLAFTLCSAIVLSACQAELRRNKRLGEFPVTQAIIIDTTYNSDYVGEIHARQNIEIRARVKGYLEKIHVDEGERVREGQVLFTISSQEYREDVLKAQAMLKSAIADAQAAEVDMQNVKLLTEKNVVSKTEITLAKAKLPSGLNLMLLTIPSIGNDLPFEKITRFPRLISVTEAANFVLFSLV